MNKVFIIGLPRTGTTSICAALLELGLRVAHTAYSKHSIESAQVIADTPIFCDYPHLDQLFPGAKFIYLSRPMEDWLPSIQWLLQRIWQRIHTNSTHQFHPILKRCYLDVFYPFNEQSLNNQQHLEHCFKQHQEKVHHYFANREHDLLSLDLSTTNSYQKMIDFLGLSTQQQAFPTLNRHGKITAWKEIKHPLKVNSHASGPDKRKFFDYC